MVTDKDIVTGRCDNFNLMNLLGLDQSSFAEHRDEQRLKVLLHRIFAVLARHESPRWGYSRGLNTAQTKLTFTFCNIRRYLAWLAKGYCLHIENLFKRGLNANKRGH